MAGNDDVLLLRNEDVQRLLDMETTIAALRQGYGDLADGNAVYIPRIDLYAPTEREDDYYRWGAMTGYCRSYGVVATRIKSDVVMWPAGRTEEKYCIEPGTYSGIILLYSSHDGAPLALLQDGYLQHLRVGGSAAIGADVLARADTPTVAVLGSGGMARSYLEAFCHVRAFKRGRVYSPTEENRNRFAREMSAALALALEAVDSPKAAVEGADIVISATDSVQPTLDPSWLAPGTHVAIVTRRELSDELVARADVTVQLGIHSVPEGADVPGMNWHAGSLACYIAGRSAERERIPMSRRGQQHSFPSLASVLRGDVAGRRDTDEVTLFVNTGTQGLQFASVAGAVHDRARQEGIGGAIPREWFLQEIRD